MLLARHFGIPALFNSETLVTMARPLSPKQTEVLEFIKRHIAQHGWPPTRGEIAIGLGLKNRQGIDQHLRALAAKGAIELTPAISRGIRIIEPTP